MIRATMPARPLDAKPVDEAAAADRAAHQLESVLVRQMLSATGAFKGSDAAGGRIHADMFVEVLADAVAKTDGLGLAKMLTRSLPHDDDPEEPAPASGDEGASAEKPAPSGVRQTAAFGLRTDPIDGTEKFHTGVDLAAPTGTPIVAVKDGIVRRAGLRGGYGNAVEIDHGDGMTTLYGHASSLAVKDGDVVHAGQTIAAVGQTGRATGPHLHFEVRMDGTPRDPSRMRGLNAYGIRAEYPVGVKGTE